MEVNYIFKPLIQKLYTLNSPCKFGILLDMIKSFKTFISIRVSYFILSEYKELWFFSNNNCDTLKKGNKGKTKDIHIYKLVCIYVYNP